MQARVSRPHSGPRGESLFLKERHRNPPRTVRTLDLFRPAGARPACSLAATGHQGASPGVPVRDASFSHTLGCPPARSTAGDIGNQPPGTRGDAECRLLPTFWGCKCGHEACPSSSHFSAVFRAQGCEQLPDGPMSPRDRGVSVQCLRTLASPACWGHGAGASGTWPLGATEPHPGAAQPERGVQGKP